MDPITFELNGKHCQASGYAASTTLLDYVRAQGMIGAKEGCAEGECGACAVLLVKADGGGSQLVPVNSCLMLLPMAAGQEVYTVEALSCEGRLAEVQQAMVDQGGSQCGYCTPGFIVSMFAEQYRPGRSGTCDVRSLHGNLCRCTGYRPIRDALAAVGPPADQRFLGRIAATAPVLNAFESHGFFRPSTLERCFEMLQEHPDAVLVAGATDIAVEVNLKGRRFEHLISLEALEELRQFSESATEVVLGAGLTLSEIGQRWSCEAVQEWLRLFASPLIRNRATLGGNLATASPIGDGAPLLLALDASVRVAGIEGERMIPLTDFFSGYRTTSLRHGEVILAFHIPKPLPMITKFFKAAKRRLDDISTVAAALAISLDGAGRVVSARLAYGGVGATPLRVTAAEQVLIGECWSPRSIEKAKRVISSTLKPISDHRGSAEYRLEMARRLLDKFWFEQQEGPKV